MAEPSPTFPLGAVKECVRPLPASNLLSTLNYRYPRFNLFAPPTGVESGLVGDIGVIVDEWGVADGPVVVRLSPPTTNHEDRWSHRHLTTRTSRESTWQPNSPRISRIN